MSALPENLPATRVPDLRSGPTLRWGVLAPGWIAEQFTDTLHRNTDSRVVAAGSRSKDRAEAFARRFGVDRAYGSYEELVSDPGVDAVYVASPHNAHAEHALLSLRAGKPTLVEKAFAQNAAQAEEVVRTARDAGLLLMEAMWTRFLPHIDVVRQVIADGLIGDVETVIADHGQHFDIGPEHRLLNPDLAGGALLDLGIYPVSFTSFVLGAPTDIVARGTFTDTGVDAQVSAILTSGSAHGLVTTTQLAKTPTTATVSGTEARIEIPGDFYTPQPVTVVSHDGEARTADPGPLVAHEGLAFQAAHFASLLADGATESPWLSLDETLSIVGTLDEIRRQIGLRYPNE